MADKNILSNLISISDQQQTCIYLIREEMKSRRFFNTLQEMGLVDCYFQPHLDTLILRSMDMDDERDETFDVYSRVLERHSKLINTDDDSLTEHAMAAYYELLSEKRKMEER